MQALGLFTFAALLLQQAPAAPNYGWLAAGASVLLCFVAGFIFGRTPLDWRMDRYNERVPWSDGCDYDDSDVTGMYEGNSSSLGSCAAWWSERPQLSGCLSGLCGLAGFFLAFVAAGQLQLVHFALWWLLVPIGVGYIAGRLSDTGPVGPLK